MRRRREIIGWLALVLVFACPFALWGGGKEDIQEPKTPIARVEKQAARIDWLPQGDYESLSLTVAGPGDLYIWRELSAGETSSFSALDVPGGHLPDGVYAYELRAISRLPEEPLVQSGHLWVQGGSFVTKAPAQPGPKSQSAPTSKPPSSITANTTVPDDLIVQGHACIGSDCVDAAGPPLKIKEFANYQIKFDALNCCVPWERQWALQANEPGSTGDFLIRDLTQATIPFRIAGSAPDNAFTILYNGNVGLGTLTPAVRLDVKANAAGQVAARLQNTSATGHSGIHYLDSAGNIDLYFGIDNAASTTRLDSVNNNPILILTNSTERMRITSTGNVGIGTGSPGAKLQVGSGEVRFPPGGDGVGFTHFNYEGDGRNYIRGTTLIADNGGSVGIGTASPTKKLHVSGSDGSTQGLIEETNGTTAFRTMLELKNNGASRLNLTDSSTSATWGINNNGGTLNMVKSGTGGITAFSLQGNGTLTVVDLIESSDRNMKTDIIPVQPEDILTKLSHLPLATWRFKDDKAKVTHLGPMAQDFSAIFGLGYDDKHIKSLDVAGVSLAAVQALYQRSTAKDAEIAELRRENADLAQRLAALEALVLQHGSENAAAAGAQPTP